MTPEQQQAVETLRAFAETLDNHNGTELRTARLEITVFGSGRVETEWELYATWGVRIGHGKTPEQAAQDFHYGQTTEGRLAHVAALRKQADELEAKANQS